LENGRIEIMRLAFAIALATIAIFGGRGPFGHKRGV